MTRKKQMISRILLNDKNITKSTFFWNAFSSVMNSFQTMVLLFVITRMGEITDASIFVMAYAVGNLVLNIGKYGVRQYQVTDVREKYSFKDYIRARYVSMLLMIAASAAYVAINLIFNGYSSEKGAAVLIICLMKAIESFEDVFHGRMQQKGRLDVAGKIFGIRLLIFNLGFIIMYIFTCNLVLTSAVNTLVSLFLSVMLNASVLSEFKDEETIDATAKIKDKAWKNIMWECLPLCICMCLNMYISNAPKYTIDLMVSDEVQTCFNIVFMPVFVIALLGTFIFQPYLIKLGNLWNVGKIGDFVKTIVKLGIIVVLTDIIITIAGSLIGTEVLGWIYQVDLSDYRTLLKVFMLAGGIIALQNLFIMGVTTVRYQKYMIFGYAIAALFMLCVGKYALKVYGLLGLSIAFFIGLSILMIYCMLLIIIAIRKSEVRQ